MVRPDRPGLKVAEILTDPGETVAAGQNLARLGCPKAARRWFGPGRRPGAEFDRRDRRSGFAARRGAVYDHRAQRIRPGRDGADGGSAEACREPDGAHQIVGAGEVEGKVRRVASTVEPNTQLGQVFIGVTTNRRLFVNSSGRAMITTGQSCGVRCRSPPCSMARPARWCRWCGARGSRPSGWNRPDVGRPDRNPRGTCRGRHRGGAGRGAVARGRSRAAGHGGGGGEVGRIDRIEFSQSSAGGSAHLSRLWERVGDEAQRSRATGPGLDRAYARSTAQFASDARRPPPQGERWHRIRGARRSEIETEP